jgi:hypothetical protein
MMVRLVILLLLSVFFSSSAFAAHLHKEKEYQEQWCSAAGGITEFVLDDGARVDCLTDEYAIEFDFAPKWAESIGQALYYAQKTGRKPGVVLILEGDADQDRFTDRLETVANTRGIRVWTMKEDGLKTVALW